jgi:hypothetical protein
VPCPGGSGAGAVGWAVEASVLSLSVCTCGVLGSLASTGVIGVGGVGLETLETFIGRVPVVAASLTRGAQRFMNPNRKIRTIQPIASTMVNRRLNYSLKGRFRAYWSRLREIVIVDSLLVLVQRMSRRR